MADMIEPSEGLLGEAREAITNALNMIPPANPAWVNEWIIVVAFTDEDGDTILTRLKSDKQMPEYRADGLLHSAEHFVWNNETADD